MLGIGLDLSSVSVRGGVSLSAYAVAGNEPKLVADFVNSVFWKGGAAQSGLSDVITFARTGTATYVDSSGVLQTAADGVARENHHIYNGSSWVNEGILHESEARTNLLLDSNDLTTANWTENTGNAATAASTGPDGETSANSFIPTALPSTHSIYQSTDAISSGTTYTFSFYVKTAGYDLQIVFGTGDVTGNPYANIDLTNGTIDVDASSIATIVDCENDWYRVSATVESAVATGFLCGILPIANTAVGRVPTWTADGTSGVYVYGAQLEVGSTPSSYIPTTSTTVTRAAETLTIAAADLPFAYNPVTSKARLVNTFGWTITDGGAV